jgi:hypothetical protein
VRTPLSRFRRAWCVRICPAGQGNNHARRRRERRWPGTRRFGLVRRALLLANCPGRVARPCLRFLLLVSKLWVPRPCVLCKGGYDAADTMGFAMQKIWDRRCSPLSCPIFLRLPS